MATEQKLGAQNLAQQEQAMNLPPQPQIVTFVNQSVEILNQVILTTTDGMQFGVVIPPGLFSIQLPNVMASMTINGFVMPVGGPFETIAMPDGTFMLVAIDPDGSYAIMITMMGRGGDAGETKALPIHKYEPTLKQIESELEGLGNRGR